jgi:HEAT repeat protein
MTKQSRILLALLLSGLLGLITYEMVRTREPMYHGKSFRAWLEKATAAGPMSVADTNCVQALQQFGATTVPTLLEMVRVTDSPLKHAWINLVRAQSLISVHLHTADEYHDMACFGFYALGPVGKEAVPELLALLDGTNQDVSAVAITCLGNIGPEANSAVPHLIRFMNDPDRIVRFGTTVTLSRIHMRPELVVPVLVTNLSPTNAILPTTINALAAFGEAAKPAVPILLTLLNQENDYVREATTNALKAIDPEAAAKAGVE